MTDPSPAPPPVDVLDVLEGNRDWRVPVLVGAMATIVQIFDGYDLQVTSFAGPALLAEWHIERAQLWPVLAANLIGMVAGAFLLGNYGDRRGRRRGTIVSLIIVALSTMACAKAGSLAELAAYRVLAGVGLGGVIPNAATLTMEFAPRHLRNMLVSVMAVGVPIGGVLGAEIAVHVLPVFGWRAIFVIGAVLPGLAVLALWRWLPESPRYLALHPERRGELADLLNRIVRERRFDAHSRFSLPEAVTPRGLRQSVEALLSARYRRDTLALWLIFFSNTFAVYAFFSWLPTVLASSGVPVEVAVRGLQFFNLGAIPGSLLFAFAMTRFGSRPVLVAVIAAAIVSVAALGMLSIDPARAGIWDSGIARLFMVMAIAGAAVLGFQVAMFSVTGNIYPTSIRATGLGWALGIARFGGILSSKGGAVLLSLGQGMRPFFLGVAVVLIFTAAGVLMVRRHVEPAAG
jgi:MFS transporter, AAHS family, 4-hydroxybenzoate transporter